ncbi:response regulator [Kineococcus sp. R8]|nr:response regulator transcription factor [Kineococcus siccus]NAZ83706.1 response regulator [Kineococcus siccus]
MRVVVADDHPMFRRGVRALLATETGVAVVGEAADGDAAVEVVGRLVPDLVLVDLQMPGGGGLDAIRRIAAAHPAVNVLVLSMLEDDDSVFAAVRAGARGYVLKDADADDLVRAVVAVGRGEAIFSPGIAARMIRFFADRPPSAEPFPDLTDSERRVLRLLAAGAGNASIARQLSLSPKTVRNYTSTVLRKLRVADRTQAGALAREAGLDAPP